MTVGFYINNPVSILASDCLALPQASNGQIYSPSNIEEYDNKNGELAVLVSKYLMLDDTTIVAFAGQSDHILMFAKELPELWAQRDRALRPMEFLHRKDYELREAFPNWNCSVVGASMCFDERGRLLVNNYASKNPDWCFRTESFGQCFAIGSGASEIRHLLENADRRLKSQNIELTLDYLPKVLGAINGKTLFNQWKDLKNQNWGGLIQSQMFFASNRGWLRTPPWLHLCVFYEGRELIFKGMHKKTVFHTSKKDDMNSSVVLTSVQNNDGTWSNVVWPIYSPLCERSEKSLVRYSEIVQVPKYVTITEYFSLPSGTKVNHSTYDLCEVRGVRYSQTKCGFEVSYDCEELGEWLRGELMQDDFLQT